MSIPASPRPRGSAYRVILRVVPELRSDVCQNRTDSCTPCCEPPCANPWRRVLGDGIVFDERAEDDAFGGVDVGASASIVTSRAVRLRCSVVYTTTVLSRQALFGMWPRSSRRGA